MKPMLAGKCLDLENLSYPVLCSPKLDGVRCLIINGQPMSRNMKPIPNAIVQSILSGLPGMDGELIVGPPGGKDVFARTSSGVMSAGGVPKFTYWVFDALTVGSYGFTQRLEMAKAYAEASGHCVQYVAHKLIKNPEALLAYEATQLLAGYEGVMIRSTDGPYKQGRSTAREGYLLKLTRWERSEAKVLGFVEQEHNENEQTRDELGRAKRSSHKSGKRPAGTLGAIQVQDVSSGVEFDIGTGWSQSERDHIWGNQRSFLGKLARYKFKPVGVKDKPRFPIFEGWRHEDDI